ncbi:MAG: hypothetical protein KKG33_06645 [candidate division Zixibacteria bacterium]|nr:hypothetical protein [candidate division Zixibacteria bacterium]MBU1469730.1 hypothetical protein [candidate division Zixibacteria bacterium]MBU2625220.1 hypothetical protein [candidate division Zixibacteria bacterium]
MLITDRYWWLGLVTATCVIIACCSVPLYADLNRGDLEGRSVTFAVDDGRVVDILKLLAAQNDLNLSISDQVEGMVTLALVDVTLADALDVITSSVSASWYIAGNIVVVKPIEQVDLREFQTRLFRLQYVPAAEARLVAEPLLPEGSKMEILSRQGSGEGGGWDEVLEVSTYSTALNRIERLIEEIDQPRPLVEIEVKIIETSIRNEKKLGFDFPDNYSLTLGNLEDDSGVEGVGTRPIEAGDWSWGRMTIGEVTLLLDLLIQNGNSDLVSNPRVTTLSNKQAEIEVSTTIPVQTLNRFSEAGVVQDIVSFQDLDVTLSLQVTPRVGADSMITLDVSSVVEEITGYTGPSDNQRPITSKRSVTSSVTVKAGESLGLGGLMKEIEHKTVEKLPLLGSIPLIGRLFQHHSTSIEKTDLIILITPRIIAD